MKKFVFGMLAVGALSLSSCGEKLMTEEQIAAEIAKGVDAQKGAVEAAADAECTARFDAAVEAEAQRIVEDAHAQQAAEKAAQEAEKKAAGKKK